MTKSQRAHYLLELWPAACAANGWDKRDDVRRRAEVARCFAMLGRADVVSSTQVTEDWQITALFVYLTHRAAPSDLVKAETWVEVMKDPIAYNLAKQADWFAKKAGYQPESRIYRDRFAGRVTAEPTGLASSPTRKQSLDRLRTMENRSRMHARKAQAAAAALADSMPTPVPPPAAPAPAEEAPACEPFHEHVCAGSDDIEQPF
jgi:hypothetical protein